MLSINWCSSLEVMGTLPGTKGLVHPRDKRFLAPKIQISKEYWCSKKQQKQEAPSEKKERRLLRHLKNTEPKLMPLENVLTGLWKSLSKDPWPPWSDWQTKQPFNSCLKESQFKVSTFPASHHTTQTSLFCMGDTFFAFKTLQLSFFHTAANIKA